jgi:hypothetical protein
MTITIGLIGYGKSANTYNVKKAIESVDAKVLPIDRNRIFHRLRKSFFQVSGVLRMRWDIFMIFPVF